MASQTPKAPAKNEPKEPKRGIKNPGIYAGTIVVLVIVVIAFVFMPMGGGGESAHLGQRPFPGFRQLRGQADPV